MEECRDLQGEDCFVSPMSASSNTASVCPAFPFLLLYIFCQPEEITMETLKHQPVLATALTAAALSQTLTNVSLVWK